MNGKCAKLWTGLAMWLVLAAILTAGPAYAADPALTAAQKTAFDRTVAGADDAWAAKLTQQYREFETLLNSGKDWERKIADLHYRNEEALTAVRKRVQQIDADKLAKLKQAAEQTKAQHQKLFDLYRTANLQLDAARKLKNKTLTAVLKARADGLKVTVQLAKVEIKAKEESYQIAKKASAAKAKKVRDTLSAVSPLQIQIRAAKSALKAPRDSRQALWRTFTQALTKRDAKTAAGMLASVNGVTRQMIDSQQKMHALENRIAETIRAAEGQLK